jgi:hypothetical protein
VIIMRTNPAGTVQWMEGREGERARERESVRGREGERERESERARESECGLRGSAECTTLSSLALWISTASGRAGRLCEINISVRSLVSARGGSSGSNGFLYVRWGACDLPTLHAKSEEEQNAFLSPAHSTLPIHRTPPTHPPPSTAFIRSALTTPPLFCIR